LMKLIDVKAPGSKTTLLHYIAELVETKYPHLLEWPEELNLMKQVPGAVQAFQQDIMYIKNNCSILSKEITSIGENADLANLKKFFVNTSDSVTTELAQNESADKLIADDVEFFGESNIQDVPGFFSAWDKFAQSFKAAVKFNHAMAKKEAALKAKEEAKKKKEDEEKVMAKVDTTLRKSRANLKSMEDTKVDGFFANRGRRNEPSSSSGSRDSGGKDSGSSGRRDRRGDEKKDVSSLSLVDDILSNNPSGGTRARRNQRDENGVVKQVSKGLRDSKNFSKIRESRASGAANEKDQQKDNDKDKSEKTKAALSRQISSKLPRIR